MVPGIYAVGDGAGVAGSKVAIEEGVIAGVSVARSLGYTSDADTKKYKRGFQKRLDKLNRFRKVLDEMSMPRAGLYELAKDDTIVCRCEEITFREIKDAMADGATHTKDIKRMTRVGMGPCEGRMCGPALIEMMRCQPNAHPDAFECLPPRPSIKPIPLGALAASGREDTTICA